jgi:hypothetical protein
MPSAHRFVIVLLMLFPTVVVAGCGGGGPSTPPDAHDGAAGAGGTSPVDAAADRGSGALASSCAGAHDCASGFCADGVCCDSPCQNQCYSCNQTAAPGHCAPQTDGPDQAAAQPCAGSSACFSDSATHLPACRIVDGAACSTDADCGSGHCLSYYVDADGDGYGTAVTAKLCNPLNGAPPAGYAAFTGDCCDIDSGANPGFDTATFLDFPDACGSYDWNCNGVQTREQTCPATPVACGAQCIVNVGFATLPLFTEGCN